MEASGAPVLETRGAKVRRKVASVERIGRLFGPSGPPAGGSLVRLRLEKLGEGEGSSDSVRLKLCLLPGVPFARFRGGGEK